MNFSIFNLKSIKSKIFGLIFLASLMMIIVLTVSFYLYEKNKIANSLNKVGEDFQKMFYSNVQHEGSQLKMGLENLLNDKNVISNFENKERDALRNILLPVYKEKLKPEYGIAQFQFHNAPATSFLRLHKPGKFGDDLSAFRKTVLDVNSNHKPVVGIEVGRGGAGLRVVLPVKGNNDYIGSVEFGGSLDNIIKVSASTFHVEYSIGIFQTVFKNARRFENKKSDIVKNDTVFYSFSNESIKNVVLSANFKKYFGYLDIEDKNYYYYSFPLRDFSDKKIGDVMIAKNVTSEFVSLRNKLIVISIVILIVSLFFGMAIFLMLNKLLKPIDLITDKLHEISDGEGDLTARISLQADDEFTEMAKYFNKFLGQLQSMIGEIKEAVEVIAGVTVAMSAAMEEVSSTSTEIATGVGDTNKAVDSTSASVTEMSANLQQLGGNIQQMAEHFSNIATATNEGAEAVQLSINTMGEIKSSSEKIENIVNVISEIAGQTNLLSLNAAIEAAKAGEQGKGFAVVAEEVRKLAERSGSAAKEIGELIFKSSNQVEQGAEIIHKAGESLENILTQVNETSDIVYQVNTASEEQGKGVNEIVQAIDSISEYSVQNATAAEEISHTILEVTRTIESVAEQSEKLKLQVERFKI